MRPSALRLSALTFLLSAGSLSVAGCDTDPDVISQELDGPSDVAVLEPGEITDVATGFVASFRSGRIHKLDLKHGTWLRDQPFGSWIRGRPIATGQDRVLDQIAAYQQYDGSDAFSVTLFAGDASREQLLVVPYLDSRASAGAGCTPEQVFPSIPRRAACVAEVVAQGVSLAEGLINVTADDDGDGMADGATTTGAALTSFELREGHTTTETWWVWWDDSIGSFRVQGSRSGPQDNRPIPGTRYYSDQNEISFVLELAEGRAPQAGDAATFRTDTGIRELELPGVAQDIQVDATGRRLFASIQAADGTGYVAIYDLQTLADQGEPALLAELQLCPEETPSEACHAEPMGMSVDEAGERLFIAEAADAGGFYAVDLSDPSFAWTHVEGPGPNIDVAYVTGELDGEAYEHLFTANLDAGTLSVYDLVVGALRDVNPATPDVDGIRLDAPVRGIAAGKAPIRLYEKNDDQSAVESVLVVATTYSGRLYSARGENGCLTFGSSAGVFVSNYVQTDLGVPSNPAPQADPVTGKVATFPSCGGIARSETWTFIYDELLRGYRVRGSRTNAPGEYQKNILYEDQRYVSDRGEFSIMIRAGSQPTSQGDTHAMSVDSNVSPPRVHETPGDPVVYDETWGDRNAGWTAANIRSSAVVPSTGSDVVVKVEAGKPAPTTVLRTPILFTYR